MIKGRKILFCILLLSIVLCISSVVVTASENNLCGEDVVWFLDENGKLTISGTGEMDNFVSPNNVPWHSARDLIKSVAIDDGIISIGAYAFYNCTALESVCLPESLTFIGQDAFFGCESVQNVYLTDISSWCAVEFYDVSSNPLYYTQNLYLNDELVLDLYIPEDVKSVGELAFCNLDCITSVTFADSIIDIGDFAFYECDNLNNIIGGDSVEVIGNYTFAECDAVKKISIPDTVKEIGQSAFYHCDLLSSVTIGNGVQTIGSSAFERCASLSDVTLGACVQTIGDFAFYNCDALKNITIPESVIKIGNSVFRFCDTLESIDIPSGVAEIGSEAFASCKALQAITVHQENLFFSSENGILFNKDKTKLIKCPPSKAVDVFEIPETVIAIEVSAFSGCEKLQNIVIPESVTQICSFAFEFCSSLNEISIGKNVKSIGPFVFLGCNGLTNITVDAENLYYRSENGVLFNKRKSQLIKYPAGKTDSEFEIPVTVTEMEKDAFNGCTELKTIYYSGTTEEWECMGGISSEVQIVYVPYFAVEVERGKDSLFVTATPKNLSVEADVFVASLDSNGKMLEIKQVEAGKQITLSAENASQIKAFAFDIQFVPAIENIVEVLD